MRKSRFSAEQIIAILNAAEAGQKVADLCRSTGSASTRFTTGERSTGGWRSATRVSCGWFATTTRRADPIKPTGQQQECVHACRRIIGSRWGLPC
jgi:Transposase